MKSRKREQLAGWARKKKTAASLTLAAVAKLFNDV
jgi:hypothetical protein